MAYNMYDLEQKKMVTSVKVQFRENEFLGERTLIDEYLVTVDIDDDDDKERLTQGETSARPATLSVSTPYTRTPSTSAATAPPAKRSHFKVPLPLLSRRISDDLYRTSPNKRPHIHDFNPPASTDRITLRDRNTIRTPSRFVDKPRQSNNSVDRVLDDLNRATRDKATPPWSKTTNPLR
ncbi:hypothetical protein H257_17088 [Aphanomyces astaci]|uniref:Uncharacterized protein n=1 Tax=Aphanomyces astaci TaxID=112090 RepID=W4FI76_APHAT|nr:hypothetical protein H257_17088 [Aphanomyces astaci]ETV66526.1 hypothetical protein H257_17088 [Aphanomyces astaci]|eukprot:XP_009844055.1 hypothetical protein H257_17088 [Aphanomyces astaci]